MKQRGLTTPMLVISDAHAGLTAAIRKFFPGASWQHCKVHFTRNILAHIPQKDKEDWSVSRASLSKEFIEATLLTAA